MVPWKVWTFGIGACAWRISCIYMPSRHTHTSWLHSHCLLALRSWEAHWGFDVLSIIHIQVNSTDWAQVGQESEQVGQVSLHFSPQYQACASVMRDVAPIGCLGRQGHASIDVCSVTVSCRILTSEGEEHVCIGPHTNRCVHGMLIVTALARPRSILRVHS